jgi:Tfp pilus assembly protein PilF
METQIAVENLEPQIASETSETSWFPLSERTRVAILLAVSILVYANTLLNSFAFDDLLYIFNNPAVTAPSLKLLLSATKDFNVFRPITFASLALDRSLAGGHAWFFHLVNLLLHAGVTLLLYLVLKKLLERLANGPTTAWVAALLFAVHPIHTEAVASIANRSELLAAGFLLGAWLLHVQDWPLSALLCFVLAMLAKESAVVFLPLSVAGDYARGKLKPLSRYGWIAAATGCYLLLLRKAQGGHFGEKGVNFLDNPLSHLPAALRLPNALRIAWKYVGLQIYPATLSCDYSYNAILLYSTWRHLLVPAVAAGLVFAIWIWSLRLKQKEWFLAGAIYFISFAVTANILVPTGTILGERLAYLPSAGFCLLLALLWTRLEADQRKLAWIAFFLVMAALATRTVVRNRDWRDNPTLFATTVRAVPGSAKAHAAIAAEYMNLSQLQKAEQEYQTSIDIYPDFAAAIGSYGLVESRLGHDHQARLLMEKALSMTAKDEPNYDFLAVNLAAQLMKLGETGEALKRLNEEIALSPQYSRAWSNRAVIHYWHGETSAARSDAEMALHLDPSNSQAQDLLVGLNKLKPLGPQR